MMSKQQVYKVKDETYIVTNTVDQNGMNQATVRAVNTGTVVKFPFRIRVKEQLLNLIGGKD